MNIKSAVVQLVYVQKKKKNQFILTQNDLEGLEELVLTGRSGSEPMNTHL